jgi:hypothetical protein
MTMTVVKLIFFRDAVNVWGHWSLDTSALLDKLANEKDFGSVSRKKVYFGITELRLLFSAICGMQYNRASYKQHYTLWVVMFMTGARPGSLPLSKGHEKTLQCLLWEDIQFIRPSDQSGIAVLITLKWTKGHRNAVRDGDAALKGSQFFISQCRDAINVVADPTWMLLQLAIDRGLFKSSYSGFVTEYGV